MEQLKGYEEGKKQYDRAYDELERAYHKVMADLQQQMDSLNDIVSYEVVDELEQKRAELSSTLHERIDAVANYDYLLYGYIVYEGVYHRVPLKYLVNPDWIELWGYFVYGKLAENMREKGNGYIQAKREYTERLRDLKRQYLDCKTKLHGDPLDYAEYLEEMLVDIEVLVIQMTDIGLAMGDVVE